MASKILNSKWINCSKGFQNTTQKKVQCTQCSNHLHLKCTGLNKNTYQSLSGYKDFICQYCSHYSCTTSDKHVYDKQGGTFCDGWNLWTRRWFTRASKFEYKYLTEKSVEPWYCKNCKKGMSPFFDLNDTKLFKLLRKKKNLTQKPIHSHQTDANVRIGNKICNTCMKTNNKIDKSFVCKTCPAPIHKKMLRTEIAWDSRY